MSRPRYTNASMDVHYKNQDYYVNLKRFFDSPCGWYLQLLYRQRGECHLSRGLRYHRQTISVTSQLATGFKEGRRIWALQFFALETLHPTHGCMPHAPVIPTAC